jgi:REP element-mobilizing transposase RayT
MSHTFSSLLVHYIFSTKNRERSIPEDVQPRLWSNMGGIARKNRMKALAIGGIEDHCHLLISLPTNLFRCRARDPVDQSGLVEVDA